MDDNTLILNNYSDKTFDFKNLITKKESIILQKCNRIEIVINSKINKLIIDNCCDIKIILDQVISGIDIDNSKNIEIYPTYPFKIGSIYCYKSFISLYIKSYINNNKIPFKIMNELSDINIY